MPNPFPQTWITHTTELIRLGLPIMISMAALIGLGVTDTVMAGLASTTDLAALAIGASVYFIPVMALIGLMSVVAPRVAWHLGAGRQDQTAHECWQAMWLGLAVGGISALVLFSLLSQLHWLGLELPVEKVAYGYLSIVLIALPLIGIGQSVRNTIDGLGYPSLNMWVSVAALLVNLVLDYALVLGKFGFPKMGAKGCAYATVFVVTMQTLVPILVCKYHSKIRAYGIVEQFLRPDIVTIKRLLVLGTPAAIAITLEEAFFTSTSFLVAPMGTTELATHQVVLIIAMVSLVFPIALGQAASILIGRYMGENNPRVAEIQSRLFLLLLTVLMAFVGVLLFLNRGNVVQLYTRDPDVIVLGTSLLVIVAVQMISDGLQIGSNMALKGYQDTFIPAVCQMISYWVVGFPLAWAFTKTDLFGDPGGVERVWYALFIGLTVAAVLGVSRLLFVSRVFASNRRQLPATITDGSALYK